VEERGNRVSDGEVKALVGADGVKWAVRNIGPLEPARNDLRLSSSTPSLPPHYTPWKAKAMFARRLITRGRLQSLSVMQNGHQPP